MLVTPIEAVLEKVGDRIGVVTAVPRPAVVGAAVVVGVDAVDAVETGPYFCLWSCVVSVWMRRDTCGVVVEGVTADVTVDVTDGVTDGVEATEDGLRTESAVAVSLANGDVHGSIADKLAVGRSVFFERIPEVSDGEMDCAMACLCVVSVRRASIAE